MHLTEQEQQQINELVAEVEAKSGAQVRAETEVRQQAQAIFPIVVVGTNEALVSLITYLIGFPVAKLLVARSSWISRSGGFSGGGSSGSR